MRGKETLTDIYDALGDVTHELAYIGEQLFRIAELMEASREDRKEREEADRELAEAESRYPGITAEVRAETAFVPPF